MVLTTIIIVFSTKVTRNIGCRFRNWVDAHDILKKWIFIQGMNISLFQSLCFLRLTLTGCIEQGTILSMSLSTYPPCCLTKYSQYLNKISLLFISSYDVRTKTSSSVNFFWIDVVLFTFFTSKYIQSTCLLACYFDRKKHIAILSQ